MTSQPTSALPNRRRSGLWLALPALLVFASAIVFLARARDPEQPPTAGPAQYVGGQACVDCHQGEAAAWRGSQHDRSMQAATDQTVLGDFAGAAFTHAGITSTFSRRDGGFIVRTEGPDGGLADFTITWTFGVEPLQQYLVDFPDGRKQALGLAWDSRAADAGGQRWFDLYPGQDLHAGDRLHWTSIDQNWNYQCADCHSTNLRKRYDEARGTFATTWTDVDVNCEACHGPGSEHVAWAKRSNRSPDAGLGLTALLDERRGVAWARAPGARHATRSRPRTSDKELDVCARCHSRRGQLTDDHVAGQAFTDAFRPALLEPGLYFPDGQQRDEVFTWGSFLQSKMHAMGVTCSDCHDPHSGKLRAPGNGVCAQCHDAATFDAPVHHHHPAGATCVGCHLPPTTYMVVDPRHDHSMRIPRPDLSVTLGTPNACTTCHADHPPAWAAEAVAKWYPAPKPGFQDFAEAFAGAERAEPKAIARLAEIAARPTEPALVRASALARAARHPRSSLLPTLAAALKDPSPLVRAAAVTALQTASPASRAELLRPLYDDPSRLVRIEVARALAGGPATTVPARANDELLAELHFNADRPEAQLGLGNFATARRDRVGALTAFGRALEIDPSFSEAAVNLAEVHRTSGDEAKAEQVLRAALARDPSAAGPHHALGLALVRQRRLPDALTELARASALAPDDARFAYVHAVALHDVGQLANALGAVKAALSRHPWDRDLLFAAASWHAEAGDLAQALTVARRLLELEPDSPEVQRLVRSLER